jgi:quinol-cytochrome oxidoreductase complex cytochrome b subunit
MPLLRSVSLAYGSDPAAGTERRIGSFMMLNGFQINIITSSMFLTAMAANPLAVPAHIVPEWYLLPFYAVVIAMPGKLFGVVAMFAFCAVWLFVPWLDRGVPAPFWRRRGMRWLVPSMAICVVVLGVAGAMQAGLPLGRLAWRLAL